MENEPQGEEYRFISSAGLRAEQVKELLAATGEIPVRPDKLVETEPEPEKHSDPKYIAEVRLMKRSKDFLRLKKHLKFETEPGVGPDEDTIEDSLTEAYKNSPDLSPEEAGLADVIIGARTERQHEKALDTPGLNPALRKRLNYEKAAYRTKLRDVVEHSDGGIVQDDIAAWLGEFSGDPDWAGKQLVPEVSALIAMHSYLEERRDLHVKYATPMEMAEGGYDMEVIPYNRALGDAMKVKTKAVGAPEGDAHMSHGVVELEVPKPKVEDFKLPEAVAEDLAYKMSKATSGRVLSYSTESRHE